MTITTERLPRSRVEIEIEVDQDRVDESMDKAVSRLAKKVNIPGFRPGKAPRQVLEQRLGTAALLQEALDELVPELYSEAIESEEIDAIDQPDIELKSTEPLILTATVPVKPEVDLNDYSSLRAPREQVEVTDEQVEESITNLRRRYAVLEPVDRGVEWTDTIRADLMVEVEGQTEAHREEGAEFSIREDSVVSLPGFVEHLIGLERGGPYDIEFTIDPDYQAEDLAGKKASYQITIHEVKREVLPDLDDEFVSSLDEEDLDTVEALQERLRTDLLTQLQREAAVGYHEEIVDLLVATADIEYPDVLVDREIDRLIDRESNHASHTEDGLNQWLQTIGKSITEVRDELRETADSQVQRMLVLSELVTAEELAVGDEQIDEEIDRMVSGVAVGGPESEPGIEQLTSMRQLFDTTESRGSIAGQLTTQLAIDRLAEITSAPEEETEAGESGSRRRGSRRRRGGEADTPAASAADGADESQPDEDQTDEDAEAESVDAETSHDDASNDEANEEQS